jgi:WD40 repeat protein
MDASADLADEIRRVLAAQPSVSAGAVSQDAIGSAAPVQQAAASSGSSITQVAAPGGRKIRVNSPDQRRYKVSLPIIPLFLRKIVTEHMVVSVITLVAVGGATTGVVVASRSHSSTPAVWSSYTVVTKPSGTSLAVPSFAPSGTMLAAVERNDSGNQVVVLDLAKKGEALPVDTADAPAVGDADELSFDPVGGVLASVVDEYQQVALINTTDWSTTRIINSPVMGKSRALMAKYTPSGAYLVLCDANDVYFYRSSDYQLTKTMAIPSDSPNSLVSSTVGAFDISPDGQTLATGGSDDTTISLWNINTEKKIDSFTLPASDATIESIAYSPDGKYIAAILAGTGIEVWSLEARRLVGAWPLPPATDNSVIASPTVEFSPDGKTLMVSNSSDIYLYTLVGL